VIALTGTMRPAAFAESDATFNVGGVLEAVQILPPGVYVWRNGRIFDPGASRKNLALERFEVIQP
jgi:L-asparaginase